MSIQASVANQQITASVGETKIDVSVGGGVGPTGPAGPAGPTYTLPTATASVLGGVKIGSGVTITDGVISVSTNYAATSHSHGNITNAGAIGTTSGRIVVTTTGGVLTTAATIPGSQVALVSNDTFLEGPAALFLDDIINNGFPYAVEEAGGISASSVNGLATVATSGSYTDLANKPTTLSGYGITDAVVSSDSRLTNSREWSADTVSQAEAEAGTATTRRAFTAQRVFQAIAAWWATITVGTSKIANGAVTNAKLASGSVTGDKLALTGDVVSVGGLSSAVSTRQFLASPFGFYLQDNSVKLFYVDSTGSVTVGTWAATAIAVDRGGTGATTAAAARTNLGLAIGTDVAASSHTHAQLHDRSHAITSTSDHTATAWRVFHSNGSGQVVELAFGDSGQALISNGASSAPSFGAVQKPITSGTAAPSGGSDGDIYLRYS